MVYVENQLPEVAPHSITEEWLTLLGDNSPELEIANIRKATNMVIEADPDADLEHGMEVGSILSGLHLSHDLICAAVLYDVVANELVTTAEIEDELGKGVVAIIEGVQRMNALGILKEGFDRSNSSAESLRKLLLAMADDIRVVLIMLAERLYLMRNIKGFDEVDRRKVARETMELYAPLANRLGIWHLKWELEDLAFRYTDPLTYKQIAHFLDERRVDRQEYIDSLIEILKERLEQDGIEADIKGRPKHIFSIWKKMQRKGVGFHDIYDARAVRVLTGSTANCYHVLGIVHGLWPHIPKEFDDYIATPKGNDYQSIHTAVVGPGGRTVEVQIRTHEMEEHAELGVAAHWRYKEGGKSDHKFEQKIAWLRRILDTKEEGSEDDVIDRFQSEIFQDRVYVVTPTGDVIDLQQGATPLDFAFAIHSEVGNRCRGAKVDGRIVPLTYVLQNGEQVEVLTTKEAKPSRDWLNPQLGYLTTSRARSRVKAWFNQLDLEQHLSDGRQILDRELQRLAVKNLRHEQIAEEMHQENLEELLIQLGRGDKTSAQIASAIHRITQKKGQTSFAEISRVVTNRHVDSGPSGSISIQGVGNLMTQMANCCQPTPGDEIIGYITVGRGVTIHRKDCNNVLNMDDEQRKRLIEVDWEADLQETFPVDIEIEAFDRKGLLLDIYLLLSNEGVNVIGTNSSSDKQNNTARFDITLEVSDIDQLSRVLNRINQLQNIIEVRRRQ
ncbi:MAG: GTP diphosphokinase [Gammaproteobacteria bacterium]|nr:GTP diphosphokinase [Gammaproteobacteria bacterium]